MAITLGSVVILPLSLQTDPGMVGLQVLACQRAWEPVDLDSKRFVLRAGHLDFHSLPFKTRLAPFVPVDLRLDFPVHTLSEPLLLRCSRGLLPRYESLDLLRQPLCDPEETRSLRDECRRAEFERCAELEVGYDPSRPRTAVLLDEAAALLDRYLRALPEDEAALACLERVRLKKELNRCLQAGDWLKIRLLNTQLALLQPNWRGPEPDDKDAMEAANTALRGGRLEVAEERLRKSAEGGRHRAEAALLLARLSAAWRRDLPAAAEWYVRYFETGGYDEGLGFEALEAMALLDPEAAVGPRDRLLACLSERLVARPEDRELAELVHAMAEAQAAAGVDVGEDFAFLWVCYEKAFEQQVAVDRSVDRNLLSRLASVYARLGNTEDWVRVRRTLADLEPEVPGHREQLAKLLAANARHEEAFNARMALWLSDPLDMSLSEALLEHARRAGLDDMCVRAELWCRLLGGDDAVDDYPVSPMLSLRLLVHPELRPLIPLMMRWAGGRISDERAAVKEGLRLLLEELDEVRRREMESASKQLAFVPALEAALAVRQREPFGELHPLSVAVRLTRDRLELAEAGRFVAGLRRLGEPVWGESLLRGAPPETDVGAHRLTLHRVRELGRFLLLHIGHPEIDKDGSRAQSDLADLIEAVCMHGIPGRSTQAYFDTVRRRHKMSHAAWRKLESEVLGRMNLSPRRQELTDF